ncbi:MAG: extracellular solute-binding protein [Lachnospiraceae bacterium]|nr:extracellular solute-binding protein [Lachnospiraceae bacterium]MCM1239336.1 extracellular solute-binding protein [Lachnospiraceae bacterium]
MKKNKTTLSIILFLTFLFMAGCGKENADQTSDIPQSSNMQQNIAQDVEHGTNEMTHWNASHFPMPEQYETATVAGSSIYACGYGEKGVTVSVFSTDSMEQTESHTIPEATEVKNISVSASEEIYLFGSTGDSDTLWKINRDGSSGTIEEIEIEDVGLWPSLKNFYADSSGLYYLWYEMSVPCAEVYEDGEEDVYTRLDRIYVKDAQMKTIVYEQIPDSNHNKLISLIFDEDGIPMLLAKDEDGYYIRRARTTDGEPYEPSRLETDGNTFYNLENTRMLAYTQDGLLYTLDGSLHLYHTSDSRDEKLLNLAGAGIREEDIIYLGMRNDRIEIIDNHKRSQPSEYTSIEQGESRKTLLTLGIMTLQPEMMEIVASFNRYQNKVTVEPIIYVNDLDYDRGYEKLTLDVIQGKAPDLIDVSGLEYESLANAGAFADLYPLMQQDDELNAESLISSILKIYEIEGHLYTIAPAFRVYTMWGAGSMINGRKGINVEEMVQMLQDNGGDINSIYGFSADEDVLTTLCTFNMDKFINWDDGTCDFTGKEFQQTLHFAREYQGKYYESLYHCIQNHDILLTLGLINSVEDYRIESELYGENIQFIGCPTENGNGSAAFFAGGEIAINSGGAHQEEAWEFVKYLLRNGYNHTGFPLLKEQFEQILTESMIETSVTEDGVSSKYVKASYREANVIDIYVYKCEPEDVKTVRELIDSVSNKFRYNVQIQNIISEETGAYFNNQKSMEEVCAIIQSRVQLYLDEKY